MNIGITMLSQAVAFAIFIWFTVKFIWPPLMRAVEQRQKQIAEGLAAAERGKKDLELAATRAAEELQISYKSLLCKLKQMDLDT